MKARSYNTASAFRRALEDRLATVARDENVDLQRIRRQVAFDRLLARLFAEGNPPWILKGAYALELKLHAARTTKDIDLGLARPPAPGDSSRLADDLLEILQSAAARDLADFFVFHIGEPMMDLDAAPYGGSRYPVDSTLDGRTFAKFHLDIGVGDSQREPPEIVSPRDWLGFAGISAPSVPSISREEHFAQKLHAYTLPREGQPNSRVTGQGPHRPRASHGFQQSRFRTVAERHPRHLDSPGDSQCSSRSHAATGVLETCLSAPGGGMRHQHRHRR